MDKEKVVTISIGLLIGLLAAGGYFFFFKDLKSSPSQKPPVVETKKPPPNKVQEAEGLTWDLPQNALISPEKIASVSGSAAAGSKIILLSNADQDSLIVGSDGKFSTKLNLEDGENKISLTYLEANKPPVTIVRQIFLEI